ncbi:hypothetical protein GCM10007100_13830 [Roseibacillus persicicus]|uniref:Knr4/Smi1-like domain-containing protein n=2 Tax=Roseibacillus persicicus TaxID=454148 RepID=A0A918WIE8_9BACT|nr:hypothetical protein GCM10007100_13830 [Roseibacillus persicicus]
MLTAEFGFIPKDYLRFLEVTDGADLVQCVFYCVGESEFLHFNNGEVYKEEYPKSEWYVFGHNAGGDPLLLSIDGTVHVGFGKSVKGESRQIADSFSEFLSLVVFGQNFGMLYGESADLAEDAWFAFLNKQGWI